MSIQSAGDDARQFVLSEIVCVLFAYCYEHAGLEQRRVLEDAKKSLRAKIDEEAKRLETDAERTAFRSAGQAALTDLDDRAETVWHDHWNNIDG